MNIEQFGADRHGRTLARINNVVVVVVQAPVSTFGIGDWIGMTSDKTPIGTIVISEPDFTPTTEELRSNSRSLIGAWHLAWRTYAEPDKLYHWRGRSTARDSRWTLDDPYVIQLP